MPESISAPWSVWSPGISRPSGFSVRVGAHGAEVSGDQRDAVGLLDAKLLGVADDEAVCGEGSDGGEDGKLVDDLRGEGSGDGEGRGGARGGFAVDLEGADEFAVVLFDGEDLDAAAERGDDVEQRGAGWVQAERVEDEVGVREEERRGEEEGGGGDVAGHGGVDGVELLAAGDAELAVESLPPRVG